MAYRTIVLILWLALLLCPCTLLFGDTGEAGPPMMKLIFGSRALSLGGAVAGLGDDPFYMDSNPAGGDTRKIYKLSILHQEWIEDVNYEAARFSMGIGDRFFAGVGFTYLYLPFVHYDYYGATTGQTHLLSQSLGVLNFGYRFPSIDITVGANLKFFYNHVPDALYPGQSYLLFAADLGAVMRTNLLKRHIGPEPSMTFGLCVKNIGYSSIMEKLPLEIHAGASYRILKPLLLSAEVSVPFYEPLYGSIGAEYDFGRKFFLEAGVQIKENPMFAFGVGYRREDMRIQASYSPSIVFTNMFSVSFSYFFGASLLEKKEMTIKTLLTEALDHFRAGRYDDALDSCDEILALDPDNTQARLLREAVIEKRRVKEKSATVTKE
ncbi:MAG: UPF0164 family protein [Spirochaetes bacterium]|nr:UPF0164 family protein [Spirochaetota bacterium]